MILAIEPRPVAHPSGLPGLCVVLAPDGEDRWIDHAGFDYRALPRAELLARLRDGGIAGLGGATFPAHVKFGSAKPVETLILNGVECEPWITTDDMLMRERAADIVRGIAVLQHLLSPARTLIGIEDNKPEAIAAMRQACAGSDIDIVTIPTLYPSGGEKQLIRILTGKEVPSGGRPLDIGVVCSNVATVYAITRLVEHGEPMISRLITITGNVQTPRNYETLIGTPMAELEMLAGKKSGTNGYIVGGPMMGLHVANAMLPVMKSTNGIIANSSDVFPPPPPAMPCIRCTRCAQVCPADLQPQELYWFAKARNFDKAQQYNLLDCIECGACSYVCPSHIPLVQYYRYAKGEVNAREKDKLAAALARERHEFHQERIERDKREKAERLAQKEKTAAAALAVSGNDTTTEQADIQAALARARAADASDTDAPATDAKDKQ
jgi:electron transport complex protein RnfC